MVGGEEGDRTVIVSGWVGLRARCMYSTIRQRRQLERS
jgi:hypothetical protein